MTRTAVLRNPDLGILRTVRWRGRIWSGFRLTTSVRLLVRVHLERNTLPLGRGCLINQLIATHTVYIGDDGIVYDFALVLKSVETKPDTFYRLQLLIGMDYRIWTRFGYIGERGHGSMFSNGSLEHSLYFFHQRFKQQTHLEWDERNEPPLAGWFEFLQRDYADVPDNVDGETPGPADSIEEEEEPIGALTLSSPPVPESKLPIEIQRLMELIFSAKYTDAALKDLDYDADKLPLGQLSKRTLIAGFAILKELADVLESPTLAFEKHSMDYAHAVEQFSDSYYALIPKAYVPHDYGRQVPPIIDTSVRLRREIEVLHTLMDMKTADDIMRKAKEGDGKDMHLLDRLFAGLGLQEMTPRK